MRYTSIATCILAILSFFGGSFLILFTLIRWIDGLGSPGSLELLPYGSLGALLVFIAFPVALFGFRSLPKWVTGTRISETTSQADDGDSTLFSNKRIVGLSLVITGVDWLILSLFALFAFVPSVPYKVACPYNGCPSVFSSLATWILIGIGLLIVAAGIVLIIMSRIEGRASQQQLVRASTVRL